ncbi:hypothetical protein PFISCL1PPCAC_5787, partial [Pristionchus fissidentatus]
KVSTLLVAPFCGRYLGSMSMDIKFRSDEQWFISPIVHVQTFKEVAEEEVQFTNNQMKISDEFEPEQQTLASFLGCSAKTTSKVLQDISLGKLIDADKRTLTDDFESMSQPNLIQPEILRTHSACVERFKRFSCNQVKSVYNQKLKFYKYELYGNKLSQVSNEVPRHITGDIIMSVNIGIAQNRITLENEAKKMKTQSKFLVRGSTTLFQIRERIMCVSDFGTFIEEGKELEKPDATMFNISLYPSSFLFIHDTFYVDTSRADCTDISQEIRDFMASKKCFGPTKVESMSGVTVLDLTLRLGQPYIFMHSGNCEHTIIFTDLRLMTKDDEQDESKYPLLTFERSGDVRCMACKKFEAGMGVEVNSRLPMTPAFFCDTCFKEFHFSHGQRLGEFKAFPYFHTSRI